MREACRAVQRRTTMLRYWADNLVMLRCWYGGRNYGAGYEPEGGTAAASCVTWRHYGAAATEGGTTELERNMTVVLLLLVARHGGTTELLVKGRNYGAGQVHDGGTAAASCETWWH